MFISESEHYVLLAKDAGREGGVEMEDVHIIVLFAARDSALNGSLVERINETRRVYVSGTVWEGRKAVRIAVSSWRVDVERDFAVVRDVLTAVAEGKSSEE